MCTTSCSVRPASVTHYLDCPSIHACSPSAIHLYTQQPTQSPIQLTKYKLVTQKSTQPLTTHPLTELSHSHLKHSIQPPTQRIILLGNYFYSSKQPSTYLPTHPLPTNHPSSQSSLQALTDPHMNVSPSKPVPV